METLALETATITDKNALVMIYEQYSSDLFRYAYRLLGDSDLAEDCVAETFSRFLRAIRDGRGPKENVRAYLYRVAHNCATDYYRRQPPPTLPLKADLHAAPESDPSMMVSGRMERERVRNALFSLPSDQRQVIELRFLEGWNHEAIASVLNKTAEATRALQYRALNSLRRLLIES